MASVNFEAARNSKSAVSVYLIWIHFDAFLSIPAHDFYFSSTEDVEFPVDNTGDKVFVGKLMKDIPKGKHQRDRGNDTAEFSFFNKGNQTYQDFLPYRDIIKRGKVIIYHCLQLGKDYYEGEIRFVGYLATFTLAESDKSLKFTAESDLSRKGFPVGARVLTRERCGTEFNTNGAAPPDAPQGCTWQLIQGGNPLNCTKFLKGPDSCTAHGNTHQFFAVTALSTAAIEFVAPDTVDFPYDNGQCFTENNFLCDENWNLSPISHAKVGQIVKAFNIFTGELEDAEVLDVFSRVVDEYSIAEFARGGKLEVTNRHLFRIENAKFMPIGALRGKWVQVTLSEEKPAKDRLMTLESVSKRATVYNLRTSSHTYLITDKDAECYFQVHNLKPITPMTQ